MLPDKRSLGDFRTDLSVGDILRRARIEKKYSIVDIELAIRVSAQHIMAIEESRLEALPGRVYTIGFIRAYAEHVGLDSHKILELLKQQSGEKIAIKEQPGPPTTQLDDYPLPSLRIFILVFVILCTVIGLKDFYSGSLYLSGGDIPPIPQDLKTQTTLLAKPEVKQETVKTDDNQIDLSASVASSQIVLKAVANVWLEIRDSNRKPIFSRVLSVGEEYWIPLDSKGLVMTLGNAGGLEISVDGQALPLLGRTGQVIRKVDLDPEKLKEILKKASKKSM
jgi:cytoskeleton protein RodZ